MAKKPPYPKPYVTKDAYTRNMLGKSIAPNLAAGDDATNRIMTTSGKEYAQATKDRDNAGKVGRDIERMLGTAGNWGKMETDINKPSASVQKMMAPMRKSATANALAMAKARKKGAK
jgi:hypothetical protein